MRGSSSDQPRSSDDATFTQNEPTAPRPGRAPGGYASGGPGDRPPSYQTEERYWTDYLRIALPIAGLLLLLSVFWFWASSFIGDNDDSSQTPVVAVTTPEGQPTLTPTLQDAVVLPSPTQMQVQPTEPPVEPTQPPVEPTQPPVEPTQPPATGAFQEGDLVVVNDNNVRLRTAPSTDGEIVDTLSQGTELRILSSTSTDAGGYTWWNVSNDTTGVEGWIAGDFLDK